MVKVTVLGAAGGIGQPLSLLLKQSPLVSDLALFGVSSTVFGVAADLSHVNTFSNVTGYTKDEDGLKKALTGADVVVIPAGVSWKPGVTVESRRDDLFCINAVIIRDLVKAIAETAPKAYICIISNPVNSLVPVAAETMKKAGVFDPKRLFGITTVDVLRSSVFLAHCIGEPKRAVEFLVPVIGGHSNKAILPLLSQAKPAAPDSLFKDKATYEALVKRIQYGGYEVVKAKGGVDPARLSVAFAAHKFVSGLIRAVKGEKCIVEPAYICIKEDEAVASDVAKATSTDLDFFALPVELGPNGAEKIFSIGTINEYETELLKGIGAELKASIDKGINFVDVSL